MKRQIILVLLVFVLIISTALIIFNFKKSNNTGSLASLQTNSYLWSTQTDTLKDRLKAINLPALKIEGTLLHTHQHLDLFINGQSIQVPDDIGINQKEGFIAPIHIHNTTGIIHVESPTVQTFTLGQFFNVWGSEIQ